MVSYKMCKTCKHFKRVEWPGKKGIMFGGHCETLQEIFTLDNIFLTRNKLYVQDTFGCVMHREKV